MKEFKEVFGKKMSNYVVLQVGSRTMQTYDLLKAIGREREKDPKLTVLLKRGMCARPEEILGAIRYLGPGPVLFCLRGMQHLDVYDPSLKNKELELPHQYEGSRYFSDVGHIEGMKNRLSKNGLNNIIVGFDPSHVGGRSDLVEKIAEDAVRLGAEFLLIETMLDGDKREELCDGRQALTVSRLKELYSILQRTYLERRG